MHLASVALLFFERLARVLARHPPPNGLCRWEPRSKGTRGHQMEYVPYNTRPSLFYIPTTGGVAKHRFARPACHPVHPSLSSTKLLSRQPMRCNGRHGPRLNPSELSVVPSPVVCVRASASGPQRVSSLGLEQCRVPAALSSPLVQPIARRLFHPLAAVVARKLARPAAHRSPTTCARAGSLTPSVLPL